MDRITAVLGVVNVRFLRVTTITHAVLPLRLSARISTRLIFLVLRMRAIARLNSRRVTGLDEVVVMDGVGVLTTRAIGPRTVV